MYHNRKGQKGEKLEEKNKNDEKNYEPDNIVCEEMVRWMTEGTNPNHIPRSDCG